MPRLVQIEEDEAPAPPRLVQIEEDEPGHLPCRVEIEEDEAPAPPRLLQIEEDEPGHLPRRVEIEEEEETPAPDNGIPILWRGDLQLWTIADSDVVFSPEVCMVIGFVYRSVLIRAPTKEVKQVCDTYKVIYLDPEKYFI